MIEPHPGDSRVQREAESQMLDWLAVQLGVPLRPRRFQAGDSHLNIDGVSDDPPILVEAWAHQGPPKPAQRSKVMNDAFKLLAAKRQLDGEGRLILLFADLNAAQPFKSGTWRAAALQEAGIEIVIAELSEAVRTEIRKAQERQFR